MLILFDAGCVECSDQKLFERCGQDAVQYQKFQRYLITYMSVTTLLCIVIVLPLNIFRGTLGKSIQISAQKRNSFYIKMFISGFSEPNSTTFLLFGLRETTQYTARWQAAGMRIMNWWALKTASNP
jgi:hypothetical protein